MKIGIVLQDRCKEEALKLAIDASSMAKAFQIIIKGNYIITDQYIVPMSEVKYIYRISD